MRYVYGHDLLSQTRDSVVSYYHTDGLGSTRTLTNSAQTVTDTYTYDAFGLLLAQTGTTDNSYLYRGEQFDHESGFYYLRARYMNPALGRFVTMDTFSGYSADPITLHKYLYANANPITYSDPSGDVAILQGLGNLIRDMWTRAAPVRGFITKYYSMKGALIGAVDTMLDRWFDDEKELTWEDVLWGATIGGISGKAGQGIQYLYGRIPKTLIPYLCKIKYLIPIYGGYGLWKELQGVREAIEKEDYDLATYRTAHIMYSIYEQAQFWKSFACFTEDTLIYTRDGYKSIKDIEVGDEVYSEDVESGEQGFKRVRKIFVRETTTIVQIVINDIKIQTTPEHPFYVPEKGWVPAGELQLGESLKFASGKQGKISFIRRESLTTPITVYNFEVDDWHTYVVSPNNVVVHNTCKKPNIGKKINAQRQKARGHLKSSSNGEKSYMETLEDAQEVLDAFHSGKAKLIWEDTNNNKIIVEYSGVTGRYVSRNDPSGRPDINLATNIFAISGKQGKTKVWPLAPTTK